MYLWRVWFAITPYLASSLRNSPCSVSFELEITNCKLQNYPNPFKPSRAGRSPATPISFSLAKDAKHTEIIIYNIKGDKVKSFYAFPNGGLGTRSVVWDGTDEINKPVSSGVYLYQLKIDGKQIDTKRCLLLK